MAAVAFLALFALLLLTSSNSPTPAYAQDSSSEVTVPADWPLKPSGLGAGDQFRLLIITSTKRDGTSTDIADYDTHVQTAVASGHVSIQSHSSQFQVVGCTAAVDARDHTGTAYTSADKGVAIYWLDGNKAADEYEDFYDGSWAEEATGKNESGTNVSFPGLAVTRPHTGCGHDGTESFFGSTSYALGRSLVRAARANAAGQGPLSSGSATGSTNTRPFYGLSAVFQVAGAATPPTLSGLTVSAGTLTPDFASGTLDYAVPDVPNADGRITVTATADADVTVAYEDGSGNTLTDADAGTAGFQADLEVGENTIKVKVTKGGASQTYTLTVTRAAPAAPATPVDITLDSQNGAPLGVWSDGTTIWVVDDSDNKLYAYTLSTGARDSGKDMTPDSANGDATGVWSDGTTIWVGDVSDAKLYAYTLSTGARDSGKDITLGGDNGRVAGVWSDGTTIWVVDDSDIKLYAYTLSNGNRDTAKEFSVGTSSPGGVWSDGTTMWVAYPFLNKALAYTISSGSRDADLDLSLRNSSRNWGLWSDGTTMWVGNSGIGNKKLFHHQLPGTSTDASLSGLALSGVTLSPDFAAATTGYTASVYNSVTATTVTATPTDADAKVVITPVDADLSAEGYQVSLDVGSNTVSVKVTAEDGTTTQTYTVTVTRAANSVTVVVTAPDGVEVGKRKLEITWVDTQDCADGHTAYVDIAKNGVVVVGQKVVDATTSKADVITATYSRLATVNQMQVWCGERGTGRMVGEVAMANDPDNEDHIIPGTYTTAAADSAAPPPTLSGLTVSAGTLTPVFAGGTLDYAVPDVPNATGRVTVTATPETGATVAYEDGSGNTLTDVDSTTDGDQFDLEVGENTIKVKVTKGGASQTYTLTVTRAAPAVSSDASLSGLALSGVTLSPDFAAATTLYTASVYNSVTSTTVTAEQTDDDAKVVITPVDADLSAEGYQVSLDVGSNVVSVKVTAEDGTTTRTYTVTVTRAANSVTAVVTAPDGVTGATRTFEITWVDTEECADGHSAYAGIINEESGAVVGAIEVPDDATSTADVITATYDRLVGVNLMQVWCGERGSGRMVGQVVMPIDPANNNRVSPGRYSTAAGEPPTLSGLTVSAGTLTPAFAGGTLEYAVPGLAYGNNRITVTATADADATVAYEDGAGNALADVDATTAGDQFDLAVGENTIRVRVTEGGLSQTYTLVLTRGKPVVSVSAAEATAGEGDSLTFTVTRTPAAGDPLTLTVNVSESGDLVPAAQEGEKTVTIAAGAAAATLTVATGADDSDWEEHSTVSVTASPNTGYTLGVASAATLVEDDDFPAATANLVVVPASVSEPGTARVTVSVTTQRNEMPHGPGGTLTVVSSDVTASAGSDYDTYNQSYALDAAGFSAITIGGSRHWWREYSGTVTVRDDTTQESAETFHLVLTKSGAPKVTLVLSTAAVTIPANDAPVASSDASLSGLALSGVTLSPDFAGATTTGYTASVANGVTSTTVTATPNHADAEAVTTRPTPTSTRRGTRSTWTWATTRSASR